MIMKFRSAIGILISVGALTLALALTGCTTPESAPTPARASESISALPVAVLTAGPLPTGTVAPPTPTLTPVRRRRLCRPRIRLFPRRRSCRPPTRRFLCSLRPPAQLPLRLPRLDPHQPPARPRHRRPQAPSPDWNTVHGWTPTNLPWLRSSKTWHGWPMAWTMRSARRLSC